MVPRWQIFDDFLHSVLAENRMQHISDLHLKFTLRPHYVWQSATAEIRRGKRKEEDRTNYRMKI